MQSLLGFDAAQAKKNNESLETSICAQRPHRGLIGTANRSEQPNRQSSKLKGSQSFLSSYESCSSNRDPIDLRSPMRNRAMSNILILRIFTEILVVLWTVNECITIESIKCVPCAFAVLAVMHCGCWMCDKFYFRITVEIWINWLFILVWAAINGMNNGKIAQNKPSWNHVLNRVCMEKNSTTEQIQSAALIQMPAKTKQKTNPLTANYEYCFINSFSWHKCNKNVRNTNKTDCRTIRNSVSRLKKITVR